jgi:AAA15 family ATPase/GTPase
MLIEYQVKNFLSFKELTTFSMVGMKSFKEYEPSNVISFDENLKILKTAVVYGNNGSGKSNFIQSLGFLKGFVLNSFRDTLLTELPDKIPVKKFLLNQGCDTLPSYFEITFRIAQTRYRYGFEVSPEKVLSEWLYHATTKEVPLFKRENNTIIINKSSFKEGLGLETKIKSNVLFLTRIAYDNGVISNQIIDWFKNLNVISGIHDRIYKAYTIQKLKTDKHFKRWVSKFVTFLEINQLSTEEIDSSILDIDKLRAEEMDEDLNHLLSSLQKLQSKQPKYEQIVTWHRRYDIHNFLIDTIPFNFEEQESAGTKKLIYLLGPWYDTLKWGKILVVDELDSRLHPNLIKYLVAFFHETNRLNAQLVFVTHSTELLSKDYLRRDQIWFIEKDQFGASKMYSLGDFKSEQVRNKSAFDSNYIDGKYGSVPYFENKNQLIHSLYGEE